MISSIEQNETELERNLEQLGYDLLGNKEWVRNTGRSRVYTRQTTKGIVWVKHSYLLPPGEGAITAKIKDKWQSYLPTVVYASDYTLVTETMPGEELVPKHPLSAWTAAAAALGEIAAGESSNVADWLAMGVRDRRPERWEDAVLALRASPVVEAMDNELLSQLDALLPEFIERFVDAFESSATLVPQDSGCCNIHMTGHGPIFFDWTDVVIGHPVFSCDRLLDQTPTDYRNAVIEAFCAPLKLSRDEFNAMRRSNVLHEVLRYHDELAFIEATDMQYRTLAAAVQSQLRVLVDFEMQKRKAT